MLLLLGGGDVPPSTPTVEVPYAQIDKVMKTVKFCCINFPIFSPHKCLHVISYILQGIVDMPKHSNLSRRIASLVRFREKRKERCFDKKIRYTVRKEVAQRLDELQLFLCNQQQFF